MEAENFLSKTIDIIENLNDFHSVAIEWNELASKFNTPLLRHEWFAACAEAFCPPGKLSVRILRENGKVVAIAPLVLNPWFGVERLEILGTAILCEPSGFLYRDANDLQYLLDSVVSSRIPILFSGLSADSPELGQLKLSRRFRHDHSHLVSSSSPWVPITQSWESFETTISARWRSTFRRAQRHAEEYGSVKFEVVTPTLETVNNFLTELLQVESTGWKSRTGTALQFHSGLCCFFREYARLIAEMGTLRIAVLRIDEKAVAVQLIVECANRLWILKVGFDENYAHCSPGVILMNRVMQYSFQQKYDAVEFLGSNEPWLEVWKPKHHIHERVSCYPPISPTAMFSQGMELSSNTYKKLRTMITKKGPKTGLTVLVKKIVTHKNRPRIHTPE